MINSRFSLPLVLLALGVMARASGAEPKTNPSQMLVSQMVDGTVDLETQDLSAPLMLDLRQDPGHSLRVLLPTTFTGNLFVSSSAGVSHQAHPVGSRKALELWADVSRYKHLRRGILAVQDQQGHSFVLQLAFTGQKPPMGLRKKFYEAFDGTFPDQAGPKIAPVQNISTE